MAHDKVGLDRVAEVLKIYEGVRLPAAQEVLERSRTVGLFYDFCHPDFDKEGKEITDETLKARGEALRQFWSRQWSGTPEQSWNLIAEELDKL